MLFFKEKGAAIVLVSHDLNLISQICSRALVLSKGKMSFLGPAEGAINHYLQLIKSREGLEEDAQRAEPRAAAEDSRRWGNRMIEILGVNFVDEQGNPKTVFRTGDHFEARISYVSHLAGAKAVFGAALSTVYKMLIYGPNTLESEFPDAVPDQGTVRLIIPSLPLFQGDYLFSASVYDPSLTVAYDHHEMMYFFRVTGRGKPDFGCVRIDSRWELQP
jgi:hypothetical protein